MSTTQEHVASQHQKGALGLSDPDQAGWQRPRCLAAAGQRANRAQRLRNDLDGCPKPAATQSGQRALRLCGGRQRQSADLTRKPGNGARNRPNLQVQLHRNGAVVGAHDLGIDAGHLHLFTQRFAHQEIVDAPSCVVGAGMEAVAPPGISALC